MIGKIRGEYSGEKKSAQETKEPHPSRYGRTENKNANPMHPTFLMSLLKRIFKPKIPSNSLLNLTQREGAPVAQCNRRYAKALESLPKKRRKIEMRKRENACKKNPRSSGGGIV